MSFLSEQGLCLTFLIFNKQEIWLHTNRPSPQARSSTVFMQRTAQTLQFPKDLQMTALSILRAGELNHILQAVKDGHSTDRSADYDYSSTTGIELQGQ